MVPEIVAFSEHYQVPKPIRYFGDIGNQDAIPLFAAS
jgi:hypothetical protein